MLTRGYIEGSSLLDMTTPLKVRYPWNDANRLELVEVVKSVKAEGKSHGLKWKEVARRLHNDSEMDEHNFGRLCAKQFDNLYRAYTKFKQDGDQPPRLTTEVIIEFDELFPAKAEATVTKVSGGAARGGSSVMDTKSSIPSPGDGMRGKSRGKKCHKLSWSNVTRINLLTAVRAVATKEGKIHWNEVAACMPNDFGISEERLCSLCMKQFTDLSSRYKAYKMAGSRPRRLTSEIIQNMDELYLNFPNLNPVPEGAQCVSGNDREEVSQDRTPSASEPELDYRSSSRRDLDVEPSSESQDAPEAEPAPIATPAPPAPASTPPSTPSPAPDSNREGDEAIPATREVENSRKRKERTEASSSQTDMSTHEDYKDDQEVGFDRVERELLQLKSWLKQEVLPVGKEVLTRVKNYGRRNLSGKRRKIEPHDDFDKLICQASQKSTVLSIRAQFQKARANILKEVKDTIERVGMDLLHRRSNPFENSHGVLPGHSQEGAL